jgi:hypothetical protein
MTIRGLVVASLALCAGLAGPARADEERFSLTLRGAAFNRDDGGYADHAEVYGLSNPEVAGGGVIEGGVRFLPRLWLLASWSGFSSAGPRRLSTLSVQNQAVLGHVGFTAYRDEFETGEVPWSLRLDLTAGGGLYTIADELDGERQEARGAGARVGAQVAAGWKAVGFAVSYGWHMTGVQLEDRLGGEMGAGGHELGAGLRLQY